MLINYLYVVAASALRLVPHPWNMTPTGAMFLFSGATFRGKRQSLLVPLSALLVIDWVLDHFLYHGQYRWLSPFTWLAFLLVGIIGWTLRGKLTWKRVGLASLAGSVVFFLVSNFGVWVGLEGTMYAPTLGGLIQCYAAGLPFFRNTVLGDLTYAAVMFGSYQLLERRRQGAVQA